MCCSTCAVDAASSCANTFQMCVVHVSTGDLTCCPALLRLSCSELKNAINGRMLTELGELEQNLVYGDMTSAELIKFLQGERGGSARSALYRDGAWQVWVLYDMLAPTGRCSRTHTCAAGTPRQHLTAAHAFGRRCRRCCHLPAEYGDALAPVDKMRLFMSYLATHPEKLDPVKKQQWAKLARLDAQDMDTVCNLAYLNVAVMKQPGSQVSGRQTTTTELLPNAGGLVFAVVFVGLVGAVVPLACVWMLVSQHRAGHRPNVGARLWCGLPVCLMTCRIKCRYPLFFVACLTCLSPAGFQGAVLWLAGAPQEEGHVPQAGGQRAVHAGAL